MTDRPQHAISGETAQRRAFYPPEWIRPSRRNEIKTVLMTELIRASPLRDNLTAVGSPPPVTSPSSARREAAKIRGGFRRRSVQKKNSARDRRKTALFPPLKRVGARAHLLLLFSTWLPLLLLCPRGEGGRGYRAGPSGDPPPQIRHGGEVRCRQESGTPGPAV